MGVASILARWLRGRRCCTSGLGALLVSLAWTACGGRTDLIGAPSTAGPGVDIGGTYREPGAAGGAGAPGTSGSGGSDDGGGIDGSVLPVVADKVDLLLMIDNSASMADKQEVLGDVAGDLLERLVNPACVVPSSGEVIGNALPDGTCATGEREFRPVNNIHIGIISSSLGSHGAARASGEAVCSDQPGANSHTNDAGHLLARGLVNGMPTVVPTFQDKGFLAWNGAGTGKVEQLIPTFESMIVGVGQTGCGYEAQLESIYRFLIDPNPFADIQVVGRTNTNPGSSQLTGSDELLLAQRRNFLRPDSLVAVIAITDENDCSIDDSNPQGFYALLPPVNSSGGSISQLRGGTSACVTNPNDRCCVNCGQALPEGCTDTRCTPSVPSADDPEALRCFDQKRRYGFDFLYPTSRYVEGFTQPQIHDLRQRGALVDNPLFVDSSCAGGVDPTGAPCISQRVRSPSLVFFAGVIGVPWQDIANDPLDLKKGYKTASQLAADGVWKNILGDPSNPSGPVLPTDPHMIESIAPRPGLPGPDSFPHADPINGHEWNTGKAGPPNSDLQYACIFDRAITTLCQPNDTTCDCHDGSAFKGGTIQDMKNPLCQTDQGLYGNAQLRSKAYPGLRELGVLQGLGDQAVVGSICASNLADPAQADWAYRPVVSALLHRFRAPLGGGATPKP